MKVSRRVFIVILSLLFFGSLLPTHLQAQPKAVKLMQDLKKTEPIQHGSIYKNILKDTTILSHNGLRQEIVELAKKVWFDRYIRGDYLKLDGASPILSNESRSNPEDVEETSTKINKEKRLLRTFQSFRSIVFEMEGKDGMEALLHVLPSNPAYGPPMDVNRALKRNGRLFIKTFLRLANYDDEDNKKYRRVASSRHLTGPFFEAYSLHSDLNNLNSGLEKRLKKFCTKALQENEPFSMLKSTCVAVLLEKGMSEREIQNKLIHPDKPMSGFAPYPGEKLKEKVIDKGKNALENYPVIEIDKSSVSDKNQQGKGHDKRKGKGH